MELESKVHELEKQRVDTDTARLDAVEKAEERVKASLERKESAEREVLVIRLVNFTSAYPVSQKQATLFIIIILNLYSAYYRKKEHRCYSKKVKNKNYYKPNNWEKIDKLA